jgi:hypothetical protein
MVVEEHSSETTALLRLRVTAEADPGALLHIQIDICSVAESRLAVIAAKIGKVQSLLDARHRIPTRIYRISLAPSKYG